MLIADGIIEAHDSDGSMYGDSGRLERVLTRLMPAEAEMDANKENPIMDLTKECPRSPYEKLAGIVMLGRTIDKARAKLVDALGDYMYDCPLDKQLFDFLGIGAEELLATVARCSTNEEVVKWVQANRVPRCNSEVEQFNEAISRAGPHDEDTKASFEQMRQQVAPDRPDIRSWFELIDAEEGRLGSA